MTFWCTGRLQPDELWVLNHFLSKFLFSGTIVLGDSAFCPAPDQKAAGFGGAWCLERSWWSVRSGLLECQRCFQKLISLLSLSLSRTLTTALPFIVVIFFISNTVLINLFLFIFYFRFSYIWWYSYFLTFSCSSPAPKDHLDHWKSCFWRVIRLFFYWTLSR